MLNKLKSLAFNKELYWTVLFQFSSLVGGVVLMKLLAVSLTTAEYGLYAIITSIVAFVLMMPFTALLQGVSRYVSIYKKKGKEGEFITSVIVLIQMCITAYILVGMLVYLFYPLSVEWSNKFFLVLLLAISEVFKIMFRAINNANRERKNIAISVFVEFASKITLVFIIHMSTSLNINDVLIAFVIANILSVIIMLNKNRDSISRSNFSRKYFDIHTLRTLTFSYPLILWGGFGWLRDMSNRWYLDYFLGKEEVALFTMIASLALIIPLALQGVIGSFFIPIIYQKENDKKGVAERFLKLVIPILATVFLIGFIILYFIKDFIVVLFTDEKYLTISWMLPWMFLAYSFYVLSMVATYELLSDKQTKKLLLSSITPGVIAFFGGYYFIKNNGLEGALYNYMLTYLSYSLLTFSVVVKYNIKKKKGFLS
ncbi:oligosaccharide flippase family protein [Pseudoalteromonas arctica]|uniref:oligosaccharide flippase family protein n=1 Tax=Pseudoalteromonas arctica TaxID=394751 RepID=UPI0024948AF9|nr:oligosaccharide flippase family protein [Pseudoalteromonas arctica]